MKDILIYSLGAFIAFAAVLIIVLILWLAPEQKELLSLCVGALIANFSMVISYYFGSSKGSADKNELLKK